MTQIVCIYSLLVNEAERCDRIKRSLIESRCKFLLCRWAQAPGKELVECQRCGKVRAMLLSHILIDASASR